MSMSTEGEGWATAPSPRDPRSVAMGKEKSDAARLASVNSKVYGTSTLAAMAANMRMASSMFDGPILPDMPLTALQTGNSTISVGVNTAANLNTAFPCDFYSDAELATVSLLQLYHRSCALLGIKPNAVVERHLPTTIQHKPYLKIHILELGKTYLGPAGTAAIVPVISACRRLTHVNLDGVGLSYSVALALVERLRVHPSVREVNLNNNDLGTTVAEKLLRIVQNDNRRIYSFGGLENTLIIPALKKKLDAALAKNYYFRMEYTPDPILLLALENERMGGASVASATTSAQQKKVISDIEVAAAEDPELQKALESARQAEADRAATAKRLKEQARQQLPVWFPVAAAEMCGVLNRQRDRMNEVLAVFSASPSAGPRQVVSSSLPTNPSQDLNNDDDAASAASAANRQTVTVLRMDAFEAREGKQQQPSADQQQQQPSNLTEAIAVHLDALCERVPLRSFQRAMKIFNVTSLVGGGCSDADAAGKSSSSINSGNTYTPTNISMDRCALFAESFGALYVDMSLEEALRRAHRSMATESAKMGIASAVERAVGLSTGGGGDSEAEQKGGECEGAEAGACVGEEEGRRVASQDPTLDIIAATSSNNNGIITVEAGTIEGDKLIAQLPLEDQIAAQSVPANQHIHLQQVQTPATAFVPRPPSASSSGNANQKGGKTVALLSSRPSSSSSLARGRNATSNGGEGGGAEQTSRTASSLYSALTRYLSEDQKDLLLVNVPKIINALRVHASWASPITAPPTAAGASSLSAHYSYCEKETDPYGDAFDPLLSRFVSNMETSQTTATEKANDGSAPEVSSSCGDVNAINEKIASQQQKQSAIAALSIPHITLRKKALKLQQWLFTMLSDKLYDARKEILDCCALLDADNTGTVYFHELCSGIGSLTMVNLFAHRREISRYMKMIRTIERQEARHSAVLEGREAEEGIDAETYHLPLADNAKAKDGDDDEIEWKSSKRDVSANTAPANTTTTAPVPSFPRDADHHDLAFVERFLKHILLANSASAPAKHILLANSASAPAKGGEASADKPQDITRTTLIDPITGASAETSKITAFALVPYRNLIGVSVTDPLLADPSSSSAHTTAAAHQHRYAITLTAGATAAHATHRCTPNFWAHATRKSLEVLMNPPI